MKREMGFERLKIFVSGKPPKSRKRVTKLIATDWEPTIDVETMHEQCRKWVKNSGWREANVHAICLFDCERTDSDGVSMVYENTMAKRTYQINL